MGQRLEAEGLQLWLLGVRIRERLWWQRGSWELADENAHTCTQAVGASQNGPRVREVQRRLWRVGKAQAVETLV